MFEMIQNGVANPTRFQTAVRNVHSESSLNFNKDVVADSEWLEDQAEWLRIGMRVFRELGTDPDSRIRVLSKARPSVPPTYAKRPQALFMYPKHVLDPLKL